MKIILTLLTTLNVAVCFCQNYTIAEKQIEEPSHVYNSFILEMNNNNTVLLQMQPKNDCLLLKVYDENHEQKTSTKIILNGVTDINTIHASVLVELNQKAVFFYAVMKGTTVSFHKLSIDPYSGEYLTDVLVTFEETDGITYFHTNNCFLKIIEDQTHNVYSVIYGFSDKNAMCRLSVNTYKISNDQVLSKQSIQIKDYYTIEFLDAIIYQDAVYLAINKKLKPQASEINGFFTFTQTNYIPKNKVSLMQFSFNNTLKETALDLPKVIYSTKAQFTIDHKNKQVNLLLSAINPFDGYGKIPSTLNIFYKISPVIMEVVFKKEMTNTFAMNNIASFYPGLQTDKNYFSNFPQFMSTDSLGNNTFIFQTVYNYYNRPDAYSDRIQKEFAVIYSNSEAIEESISFLPYYMRESDPNGQLDAFSFEINGRSNFKRPRPHEVFENYVCAFEVDHKIVFIYNLNPKNAEKNIPDKFSLNRREDVMIPMIGIVGKSYYSRDKVFKDLKDTNYSKIKFNMNTTSYNKKQKTYVAFASELSGSKERLVWIKFK